MKRSDVFYNKYDDLLAKIEHLVGQGQLSQAIDELMKIPDLRKQAISLSGLLNDINTQIRKQLVTAEQGLVEHNRIRNNVLKLIYGKKIQSSEEIKSFDNYNVKMEITEKTPISFDYIEPKSLIKFVNHAAIEAGMIIRLESLINRIKKILNSSEKWILLYGESGMSKTTQAKIVLHDLREKYMEQNYSLNICIIENINRITNEKSNITLEELVQIIKESSEEWLIFIDDLHDSKHGEISKKFQLLYDLTRRNVHLIATSRLSIETLKILCEDKPYARRCIDFFEEINVNSYWQDIDKAKRILIQKIRPELTKDDLFQVEYLKYGTNFIFLILAIKYWKSGDKKSIIDGVQTFLENEFKAVIKLNNNLNPKTLFRVFVGACFKSIFDEDISYKDFNFEKDSKEDLLNSLHSLALRGLLNQTEGKFKKENKNLLTYRLQHARIAELYLEAFRPTFLYNGVIFNFKELITLKYFNIAIDSRFKIEDYFKDLITLEELEIKNYELDVIPDSIGDLILLKKLYLINCQITKIPDSLGNLNILEVLDLSHNKISLLPETIGNLSSLIKLKLRNNMLNKLPKSIKKLTKIKKLDLNSNPLYNFPNLIINLRSLEELTLSSTNLDYIPKSIKKLKSIRLLDLSNNPLKWIPDSIIKLNSLEILRLSSMLAYEI
ncbi:MAG: AAA family ATPase, partial [Promethearchaeota archaeon]